MKHLNTFKLFESKDDELDEIKDILQRVGETAPILLEEKNINFEHYLIRFKNKINLSKQELDNVNDHLKSVGWEIISTHNNTRLDEFTFFIMRSEIINAYKSKGLKTVEDFSFKYEYCNIKIGDKEISIREVSYRMYDVTCSDENIFFKFNDKMFCNIFIIDKQIKYLGIKSYFDRKF